MKNLKIGKKLLVGFAVPIGLTIIMLAVILATNLATISNVGVIRDQTDIWNYAQNIKTDFDAARISANAAYYNYSAGAADPVRASLDGADKTVSETIEFINNDPALAQFLEDAENAQKAIGLYRTEFEAMITSLDQAQAALEVATATGSELATTIDAVTDRQIELVTSDFNAIQNGGNADVDRRIENLTKAVDVTAAITAARIPARAALSSYTVEGGKSAQEAIATALNMMNEYYNSISDATNRNAVQNVITALTNYSDSINDYITAQDASAAAAANFSAAATQASGYITTLQSQNDTVNATVDETDNTATIALIVICLIVVASIILTVVMAGTVTKSITAPVSYVTYILGEMGTKGKTTFSDEDVALAKKYAQSKDEAGECAANLVRLTEALNGVAVILSTIAKGDLTYRHTAMSEHDIISLSIITMLDNLNNMFGEIDQASEQVTLGAGQISDASQSLAEGSTEQAATVEELSASIQDVAAKTKLNAERAADASELSKVIKGNAETGSHQMSEMTEAVNEINAASQDISKVIKVIDDIAFQTNILALNAAVEAARAGEAGKGFAVVADEVRNLAS
jgi:hypothetical protein